MTLRLTTLQNSSRTRVLWGTTMITPLVPNRPLMFDVLAIKVEGYMGHSNNAMFSTVPVPKNSQQPEAAKQFGRHSVRHARPRQTYLEWKPWSAEQLAAKLGDIIEVEWVHFLQSYASDNFLWMEQRLVVWIACRTYLGVHRIRQYHTPHSTSSHTKHWREVPVGGWEKNHEEPVNDPEQDRAERWEVRCCCASSHCDSVLIRRQRVFFDMILVSRSFGPISL